MSGGDSRRCVCRPVNTSFSAVALGCTAQCVKESKPVLNAVSRKCETVQRAAFPPTCSWRMQSVKSRLQQLETSVSLQTEARSTLQGNQTVAFIGCSGNQTVAFIGCSLRMRRHAVILHHCKYTSNSLVASTEHNY